MLDKLSKHHNLWVNMVIKMGADKDLASDIVQDMYLRLHKLVTNEERIMHGNEINRYFVYVTLKNMYLSHLKGAAKYKMFPMFDNEHIQKEFDIEEHELENGYFTYLMDKLDYEVIEDLDVVDKILYYLHFIKRIPQRKISRESKVGMNFINRSCKSIKSKITDALGEDVEDFFNKDYRY